jgi:guanine deaminase
VSPEFLERAVRLARDHVESGGGGPFGAVIVRQGRIVAEGVNLVTASLDPTAHAEVTAIRRACVTSGEFELRDCDIYSSCEPCPMCLGAIYWARLQNVYYAASRHDAAAAGFDDEFIYREFASGLAVRRIPLIQGRLPDSLAPFEAWRRKRDKILY